MTLTRIILHWTAGGYTPNGLDKRHYHFLIDGDGNVVTGNNPPEANARIANPSDGDTYAPHTRGMNTGSIGVAIAAMRGAVDWPFDPGPSPIRPVQVDALVRLCADLSGRYNIPVTPETVLTHAEVQDTLGVKQRGKWDIRWLPGMAVPGGAAAVGNVLRNKISAEISPPAPLPTERPSAFAALFRAIMGMFRGAGK